MEATAGAAPSNGAGTGSAQGASTSSSNNGSNSAAQPSTTQRQPGAASPSSTSTIDNRSEREARQTPGRDESGKFASQQPADDDPDFDFGERGKVKRSRVVEDFNRMRQSQAAEAKRASELHKQLESERAYRQHLEQLGIDPQRFSQDPKAAFQQAALAEIQRQIEEAQMDPRELEFKRREETLKERESRIEAETKQRQEHEHTTRVESRANEFASEMHEALSASNLPRNPQTVARMASLMLAAARSGKQIPKAQLAAAVAQQVASEQQFHASSLSGDAKATAQFLKPYFSHFKGDGAALAEALGADNTEALRKHLLSEAQSKFNPQPSQPRRQATPKVIESKAHPNGYITWDEMQEQARQRRR